jgi:hypothetical protein
MDPSSADLVQPVSVVNAGARSREIREIEPRESSLGSRRREPPLALRVEPAVRVDVSREARNVAAMDAIGQVPVQAIEQQLAQRKLEFTELALARAAQSQQNLNQASEAMSADRMHELAQREKVQALMKADAPQPRKEVAIEQGQLYP